MSLRAKPILRHPVLGVPLPWLDTRVVSAQTMCEYLDCDYQKLAAHLKAGEFAGDGCTVQHGNRVDYVPAAIWAYNRWLPAASVMAILASVDGLWNDAQRRVDTFAAKPLRLVSQG